MFLAKSDLFLTILQDELAEITRNDDTLIIAAMSSAIAEMKVYLHDSYDTDAIFNATGQQRHGLLVNLGSDMAVYFIVARCMAGQQLADREVRYKRAITTLKAFRDSETYADLPRRPLRAQKQIWFTSNRKRGNYFGGAESFMIPTPPVLSHTLPTIQIQTETITVQNITDTIVAANVYAEGDALEIYIDSLDILTWTFIAPSTFILPYFVVPSNTVTIKKIRTVQSTT